MIHSPFTRAARLALLLLPLLALGALLPGCRTAQLFPTPAASWQTYTGQMHYGGKRSVVGDVVVRRSGTAEFQLGFSSGPGFPLMQLRLSGDHARAEGALARGSWQGSVATTPKPLRSWVNLRTVFNALPGHTASFSGSNWRASAQYAEGRLVHLEISYDSGERFTFHFSS